MPISAVTPHPVSSSEISRWVIVVTTLAFAGLIVVLVMLSSASPIGGPGPAGARPVALRHEYFRDPATHALLPLNTQAVSQGEASPAMSHSRP
jgi:hypothetical protein